MNAHAVYGIAVFHHIGDVLCSTPIARQLKADDPSCEIVWYTSHAGAVALRENPYIDEIVVLDGDQYALDAIIPQLQRTREWTRFFTPAAYMNYDAVPGGSIHHPRGTIFGLVRAGARLRWTVPFVFPFHLTPQEQQEARTFWEALPQGKRILVETDYRSEQSPWTDQWNLDLIDKLGHLAPVFVFTAKEVPPFFEEFRARYPNSFWCHLPFRLNAELFNLADGFIGVSSGISCLTYSDYCRTDLPRIEVTRGEHWGAAQLTHHRELFLCYSRRKYLEALEHFAELVAGHHPTPDFSPALLSAQRGCPQCGEEQVLRYHREDVMLCRSCHGVWRTSPCGEQQPELTVDRLGSQLLTQPISDFLASTPSASSARAIALSGALEQVADPRGLFERLQFELKDDGVLTVSAMNRESVIASSHGAEWAPLTMLSNRWLFSARFLKETLIQAGFTIDHESTVTLGAERRELLRILQHAHTGATSESLDYLAQEVDRRGGGASIVLEARRRGAYKGRIRPVAHRAVEQSNSDERRNPAQVTIVIPFHGEFPLLRSALVSVTRQSDPSWAAVVVGDGLDDRGQEKLRALIAEFQDPRINAIHTKRVGPDEARDLGAATATTPWLVFLDADDSLAPTFLAQTLATVKEEPGAAVVTVFAQQSGCGSRVLEIPVPDERSIRSGYPYPTACLLRRELWTAMGGCHHGLPAGSFCLQLWHAVLRLGAKCATVPAPLLSLRTGDASQLYRAAHPHWRLLRALTALVHPILFRDEELVEACAVVRASSGALRTTFLEQTKLFPGLPAPHLFLALSYEGIQLFSDAQREYDAWQRVAPPEAKRLTELLGKHQGSSMPNSASGQSMQRDGNSSVEKNILDSARSRDEGTAQNEKTATVLGGIWGA